ncbi:MAG: hypothetical protein HQ530_03830 [Parcubacteria group bacterium]|nr:hypothetical protein [Parcubacteria group bacterium]
MQQKQPVVSISMGTGAGAGEEFSRQEIRRILEDLNLPVERVWKTSWYHVIIAIVTAVGLGVTGIGWILRYLCGEQKIRFVVADLQNGGRVVTGSRHGEGHKIPPCGIDWVLNMLMQIWLGVSHIWATSACGAIEGGQAEMGRLALIEQTFDAAHRNSTFFRRGPATHVSLASPPPTCSCQNRFLADAAKGANVKLGPGVNYVTIDGPSFGNALTSKKWRQDGYDVVGQCAHDESRTTHEGGIHYSCLALPSDWDAKEGDEASQEGINNQLPEMMKRAVVIFKRSLVMIYTADCQPWTCKCENTLDNATITPPEQLSRYQRRLLNFLRREQ